MVRASRMVARTYVDTVRTTGVFIVNHGAQVGVLNRNVRLGAASEVECARCKSREQAERAGLVGGGGLGGAGREAWASRRCREGGRSASSRQLAAREIT